MRMLEFLFNGDDKNSPPGLEWERDGPWRAHDDRVRAETLAIDGVNYHCHVQQADNSSWTVAYGTTIAGRDSKVFLLKDGAIRQSWSFEQPTLALVADNGRILIRDAGDETTTSGSVHAFDAAGREFIDQSFDANIADCDIADDGSLAVVQTRPMDAQTYLFDLDREYLRVTVDRIEDHGGGVVRFYPSNNPQYIFISDVPDNRPLYALDLEGDVVWKSNRQGSGEPFLSRLTFWR